MNTIDDATNVLNTAWPSIKKDCLSVFGSELHYQAMIYNCLRTAGGVPISQLGMNVKMWIDNPVSKLFDELSKKKHIDYQGGFETIPDLVFFKPEINGDWRRRNRRNTLINMLLAIEVKASERKDNRLTPKEVIFDIEKLAAHREEVTHLKSNMLPVMIVIDSAPLEKELMTEASLNAVINRAKELGVDFLYCSSAKEYKSL